MTNSPHSHSFGPESLDAPDRHEWQHPDQVVAAIGLRPGMTVVDLGAGTGYFLSRMSDAVGPDGTVLALEINPDRAARVRERIASEGLANVDAQLVPPDDPQLDSGSVDRVLAVNTWHHIEDRTAYARRLHAALRPGGEIWMLEPRHGGPAGPHHHGHGAAIFIPELQAAGFEAEWIDLGLPHQRAIRARPR